MSTPPKKPLVAYDDDGYEVRAGSKIQFSYGIPPVKVVGEVVEVGGKLVVKTPGHTPPECNIRSLRRYVGSWYCAPKS